MSVDLGFLDEAGQSQGLSADPFRPRAGKRKGWAIAFLGLAAAAAFGTVAVRQPSWAMAPLARLGIAAGAQTPPQPSVQWPAPATTAVAAEQPSSPPQTPTAATTTVSAPVPNALSAVPAPAIPTASSRADKTSHGSKASPHRARSLSGRARSPARKGPAPFTTDGNKFDPLNSTIQ